MNGYNYSNGMNGEPSPSSAEYCREQVAAWRAGEIEGWSAKRECELMGHKLDLRTGKLSC